MPQPSFTRTRNLLYTQDTVTWENTAPSGKPPVYGGVARHTERLDPIVWESQAVTSAKTPKPWPNGRPSLKAWNPYRKDSTLYLVSTAAASYSRGGPQLAGAILSESRQGSFGAVFPVGFITNGLAPDTYTAQQRCLSNIKNMDWNVAEFSGELHQTAKMFVDFANRVGNAILAVKRGDVRRAMKVLDVATKRSLGPAQQRLIERQLRTKAERQIASDWLAINYGVIPLASDLQAAVKHVQNRNDWTCAASGSSSVTSTNRYSGRGVASNGGTYSFTQTAVKTARARCVVQYRVSNPGVNYVKSLGLTNLPSLAWELSPGSLIVDWALPIGTWLSNMDATWGLTFVRGTLSTSEVTSQETLAWHVNDTPNATGVYNGYGRNARLVTLKNRGVLTSFPTNGFPSFKNPATAKHAANGLAFLVQAFHK